MYVITGLNEAQIENLVRSRASFEINGLRGNFMAGVKLVEIKIESLGMKCRVKSDLKSTVVQGGALGAAFSVISAPATLTVATLGIAAGLGHNRRLRVIYKK